jgi:hypothetical protein
MASPSRFWVFWMTNTMRNVTIVVPVLMASCRERRRERERMTHEPRHAACQLVEDRSAPIRRG